MTFIREVDITAADSPSIDGFGRWRVSEPKTIFDSKHLYDASPLLWDDSQTSGSGTSSTHSSAKAEVDMSVSATTAGTRVRQTFMRFNYQPGKSQQIIMTGVLGAGATGITRRIGYFDDDNGLFFELDDSTLKVVRRTSVTGSAVDNATNQSSWNLDTLDGNGPSGITLDTSKTQIFFIDFEWLGVGRVRMGFVIDGLVYYCHEILNANTLTEVYMSTPNLPLRYEISNDGTGAAASLKQICGSVISEGGQQTLGITRYVSNEDNDVQASIAGTVYALAGLRLKTGRENAIAVLKRISVLSETNDDFEWLLCLNPTVSGTFTYNSITNSSLEFANGATNNNTVSDTGTILQGGYSTNSVPVGELLDIPLRLGFDIAGAKDEIVLCVRPLTAGLDAFGGVTFKELL